MAKTMHLILRFGGSAMAGFYLVPPHNPSSSEDQYLDNEEGVIADGGSLWATVYMDGDSRLTIFSGGALNGIGQGVVIREGAEAEIANEGAIIATATGIFCEGPSYVFLFNSGEISGAPSGISLSPDAVDAIILNNTAGSIRGHSAISVAAAASGASFALENYGLIQGERWGISCRAQARILNNGRITSDEFAIVLGEFSDRVTNVGTIEGIIDLGGGNNRFFGADGLQGLVRSGAGKDFLSGGQNDETLRAGAGQDTVFGGGGRDVVTGQDGNDHLQGGRAEDTIYGGNGQDTLLGGDQNDTLNGGLHRDVMTGGAGVDTFVFLRGNGEDTITDFQIGGSEQDRIILRTTGLIPDFAALMANHAQQSGTDVVIRITATDVLRLQGVLLSALSADDFLLS